MKQCHMLLKIRSCLRLHLNPSNGSKNVSWPCTCPLFSCSWVPHNHRTTGIHTSSDQSRILRRSNAGVAHTCHKNDSTHAIHIHTRRSKFRQGCAYEQAVPGYHGYHLGNSTQPLLRLRRCCVQTSRIVFSLKHCAGSLLW